MKQSNDPKLGLLDSDENGPADDESSMSAGKSDDAETQPPEGPDDPLADPQVKAGFEKLQDLLNKEGDVEVDMGRELNRVNEALKDNKGRHGRWGEILKDKLGIGYKKASRARAHAKFYVWAEETGNLDHLSKIPRSGRYLLGAPKTTDEKREEVISHVKENGPIDIETVETIVGKTKSGGAGGSKEDLKFRVLTEGFDRWLKKFNKADPKDRDRVTADVRQRHPEFVTSICPPPDQTEKPKAKSKSA